MKKEKEKAKRKKVLTLFIFLKGPDFILFYFINFPLFSFSFKDFVT
jgi:hypothetical protein